MNSSYQTSLAEVKIAMHAQAATLKSEKLYTVDEVAEALQCSRGTVYRHWRTGQLKSIQYGGRRRMNETQVKEAVEHGYAAA